MKQRDSDLQYDGNQRECCNCVPSRAISGCNLNRGANVIYRIARPENPAPNMPSIPRKPGLRLPATGAVPIDPIPAMRRAVGVFQAGDLAEAERISKAILVAQPDHFNALHLLGVIKAQRGDFEQADRLLSRALKRNPASAEAYSDHGNVLRARGHIQEALASYDRALAINPKLAGVLNSRGGVLSTLKRHTEALASYDRALALKPGFVEALNNRSGALKELKRFDEALAGYDRALAIKPNLTVVLYNRGGVLSALKRHAEALASYDRALALKPDFAEALNNRAGTLLVLNRHEQALASCDHALAIKPAFAEALHNRGTALSRLGRHEAAIKAFRRALDLNGGLCFARGALLHSSMHCCDWRTYEDESARVIADAQAGGCAAEPFVFLGISDSAQDQLRCAQTWVREQCPQTPTVLWTGEHYTHDRIRLAYVSTDFREHALSYLMGGLFEQHDRTTEHGLKPSPCHWDPTMAAQCELD